VRRWWPVASLGYMANRQVQVPQVRELRDQVAREGWWN
jgi:hypothetical protein